jgi:hypothetical protein
MLMAHHLVGEHPVFSLDVRRMWLDYKCARYWNDHHSELLSANEFAAVRTAAKVRNLDETIASPR